jgi:hypothetical protein
MLGWSDPASNATRFSGYAILHILWGSQFWLPPAFSRRLPGAKASRKAA